LNIFVYIDRSGFSPFEKWLNQLNDKKVKSRILARFKRVELDNLGDYKHLEQGIYEFRFHFGPGYRVYFAKDGNELLILFTAGNKNSQRNDILKALKYYSDYLKDRE